MKKHKALKIVLISIGSILGTVVLLLGGVLIFASVTTLHVKDVEEMKVTGSVTTKVDKNNELHLI